MKTTTGKELTPEEITAWRSLRKLWNEKKRERGLTQDRAAIDLDWSPATVNHYLNGRLPIGVSAALRWAQYLGVEPTDIRPDFEQLTKLNRVGIDLDLLAQCMQDVAEIEAVSKIDLGHEKRARLTAAIYKQAIKEGAAVNKSTVRSMIEMMSSLS